MRHLTGRSAVLQSAALARRIWRSERTKEVHLNARFCSFLLAGILAVTLGSSHARAQQPEFCDPAKKRALVLSGGGFKGAFQAGAVYHLVVHRRCDFHEFAGVSAGSLSAVFLAQAEKAAAPEASLENLARRSEGLVSLWDGIRKPKQIYRKRWPGWTWAMLARLGLFGMENLYSFDPLLQLLKDKVDVNALAERGRPVRVGSVSFWDGTYREFGPTAQYPNNDRSWFLFHILGSASIPVISRMPQIPDSPVQSDPKLWPQYTDGGVRHNTPITSYFRRCRPNAPADPDPAVQSALGSCKELLWGGTPPPLPSEQLFVVVTAPYTAGQETYPVPAGMARPGTHQVTDGRKILFRTLDMILESAYRGDLNLLLAANDLLDWRQRYYATSTAHLSPERLAEFDNDFAEINREFPVESYNLAPGKTWSLPYEMGLVAPEKVYTATLDVSPSTIADQLHFGCLAADAMMQKTFGMAAMAEKCKQRFPLPPPAPEKKKKKDSK